MFPQSQYANKDNSHWPGSFGSTQNNLAFGLPALRNNAAAANASQMRGGSHKQFRSKIKNILHKYRTTMKRRIGSKRRKSKTYSSRRRGRRTLRQRGGYSQFGSNIPNTPSYSTGGIISPSNSALANPVPHTGLSTCTNCVDNYNHNTNRGFQV